LVDLDIDSAHKIAETCDNVDSHRGCSIANQGGKLLRTITAVTLICLGFAALAGAQVSTPEIDPGTGINALALAGAAIVVLRSRRKK
jgi:hypothetical protein